LGPVVGVQGDARERGAQAKRDALQSNVVLRDETAIVYIDSTTAGAASIPSEVRRC
jgi:hypothetical protein